MKTHEQTFEWIDTMKTHEQTFEWIDTMKTNEQTWNESIPWKHNFTAVMKRHNISFMSY